MTAKHWIVGRPSLAVAAVLGAGCDSTSPTGEEAEALALRVGAASMMARFEPWSQHLGVSREHESLWYEFSVPCSGSGNVRFSGTSKLEGGSFDVDGVQAYNGCAESVQSGGTTALSGTVRESLSFTDPLTVDHLEIDIKGWWRGTVVWPSSGDGGECEVDLTLGATYTHSWGNEFLDGGLHGTVCTTAVDAPFEEWFETR